MALLDRFQRNIVRCSNCGEEIGRGENLGFTSALCAKCSAEVLPQFKKDEVPYVPPPFPARPANVIELPPDDPEGKRDLVAISAYEGPPAKPAKKKKDEKKKGKSVTKAIKSLTRLGK